MENLAHQTDILLLREVMIFLAAAICIVLILNRLGWSPVVGYLVAGAVIGPAGLALVHSTENIHYLANLGIVFLMFTIGLELSLRRLWQMRTDVFGLGLAQVVITGTVIGLAAFIATDQLEIAVVVGAALALSSTAVVLAILIDTGGLTTRTGRKAFSILLFQDLAVVPILLLISLLATHDQPLPGNTALLALVEAVAAILLVLAIGRWLLRPFFRLVASTRSAELFAATTLLTILGTSTLMSAVGLSMALGAFLAGLVLAETEYRQQVEADIAPYKGLLLGLFFITVGMGLDWRVLISNAGLIMGLLAALIITKAVIVAGLAQFFDIPAGAAARLGLTLAQAGEFAFVVFGLSLSLGLMPVGLNQILVAITGLGIALTPALESLGRRIEKILEGRLAVQHTGSLEDTASELEGHVVIAGFGRVGQTIAKILEARKITYVALDLNPQRVEAAHRRKVPVFYGNAARPDILKAAALNRASTIVITLDRAISAARAVTAVRAINPNLDILVRARDREHGLELERIGATDSISETLEASLQLGARVLQSIGTPVEVANQTIEELRQAEFPVVQKIIPAHAAEPKH